MILRGSFRCAILLGLSCLFAACGGGGSSTSSEPVSQSLPVITHQPQSLTVSAGQTAQFQVAAMGSSPLSYRWRKDGLILPGATSEVLTIAGAQTSEAGSYSAEVSNAAGSALSQDATLTVNPAPQPALYVAIAIHSEDRNNPLTPDYQEDKTAYAASRAALLAFSQAMAARQMRWNWQSDYNFLEACRKWEIQTPDAALLALTGGKNVVRHLHEDLGVECDPHSHENDGYNYADIAYLLQACGVAPTPVVGGHVYDPSDPAYQDWPRFNEGIIGLKYPDPDHPWKPELMMGAATRMHRNDPTASGMWRPQSSSSFFSTGGSGVASFGGWDGQASSLSGLAQLVSTRELAEDRMWTFTLVLAQQYFVQAGYLETQVLPVLDQIASLRDSGMLRVLQFTEALDLWKRQYGGLEAVYRPNDGAGPTSYFTFTLNTQDFSYPEESSALVARVLDLHEATGVPVDVSFTSSQAVLFAAQYPALWERLRNSPVVALSTHVRAPKPYANNFDWLGMGSQSKAAQQALVLAYESRGVDPETGRLTDEAGGYSRVQTLAGYAPFCIGAMPDPPVAQAVCSTLAGLGARFVVAHGQAANLGDMAQGLALKPEHVDLRLFDFVGSDPGPILEAALLQASALPGATAPYFVGVKMHDNDFFAQDSAWITVYTHNGPANLTPPWDLTQKSRLLSQTQRNDMWSLYDKAVRYATSIRTRAGLVNLRDVVGMLPLRQDFGHKKPTGGP